MFLGIVLNVMAGLGSFLMGFLDDKVGGKKTIEVSLFGLSLAVFFAIIAPDLRGFLQYLLGGNIVPSYINSKNIFWFSAILIGIFSGPNQASSRSLMGRFTPEDKKNEFFGFYAFSGKATAFIGPILFGLLTVFFNSQRVGISVVFLFLLIGFLILRSVEEDKGMKQGGYYNNN